MEPLVLSEVFSSLAPLRVTSSASMPSVDIVYIVQRTVGNTEFRNYLSILYPILKGMTISILSSQIYNILDTFSSQLSAILCIVDDKHLQRFSL